MWAIVALRCHARQRDYELAELSHPGIHADATAVLFHNDVVAEGQAETCTFARRLRSEEGIEYPRPYFVGHPSAVVADPNFNLVLAAPRADRDLWLIRRVAVVTTPLLHRMDRIR